MSDGYTILEEIIEILGTASQEGMETMKDGYTILGKNIETSGDSFTRGCGNYE
jgi:hypothetical protein